MHPSLEIVEGPVSPDDEHMSLSHGSVQGDRRPFPTVARVAPPRDGIVMLDLLIDNSTTGSEEAIAEVRRQVRWLFVEKDERYPWAYAQHHCTTAANIPTSGRGRR